MHTYDDSAEELTQAVISYALERLRMDPPLDGPKSSAELRERAGTTITADGIGGVEALRIFAEVLAPACISIDHPRFLSFVPAAPTEASVLFDLVVGASSIYGGSWLEGSGAVHAENETLRWIADLAGLPSEAGGVFVAGGTAGNLSALVAARWNWRHRAGGRFDRTRGLVLASAGAHSSVAQAARAIDADIDVIALDDTGRMRSEQLLSTFNMLGDDAERVFAVVATAGTTNAGMIDDLDGIGRICNERNVWFHVDGAYGAAALAAPSVRHLFVGIERCDSFIVDPHKWLFSPYDCCALLYRDPRVARAAHTQHAEYLDVLHEEDEWNPSDFAHHLSRRVRGLPLWFSLATHGTASYGRAVEITIETALAGADLIRRSEHLELVMEPQLSIVLFRRKGWNAADYRAWSDAQLASQSSFLVPTSWAGEDVLRYCIVNPRTTLDDLAIIFESLR